jgi:hypothetical protein
MAPLLLSALVGFGVKIASDLVMSGAKQIFKGSGAPTTFAGWLDKVKGTGTAAAAADVNAPKPATLDAVGVDRARLLKADAVSAPAASRAQAVATYQRLEDIPQQAA